MVRKVMRDIRFLRQKSVAATRKDAQVGQDLLDTLKVNVAGCVGMAANMIGEKKNIIVVNIGFMNILMYNPVIVAQSDPYDTEEGCLSLVGVRPTKRYENIEVEYEDANWNKHRQKFKGWTAQIIQHEIDHCNGIVI